MRAAFLQKERGECLGMCWRARAGIPEILAVGAGAHGPFAAEHSLHSCPSGARSVAGHQICASVRNSHTGARQGYFMTWNLLGRTTEGASLCLRLWPLTAQAVLNFERFCNALRYINTICSSTRQSVLPVERFSTSTIWPDCITDCSFIIASALFTTCTVLTLVLHHLLCVY